MLISQIIVTILFILVMVLIVIDKINRAILAIIGAIITYCVLVFLEHVEYHVIIDLIIGNEDDDFVEFRSMCLILSMMIIVEIAKEGGVFQFLSFRLIQLTGGKPLYLLAIFCSLSVLIAALLSNLLTLIVLVPLTYTVTRILRVNPTPYVLSETYFITIGGTILPISSIPGVLISFSANIAFSEFFLNIGLISIFIYFCTLFLFLVLYRNKLDEIDEGIEILLEYNVWSFVEDRGLMKKSLYTLIIVVIAFIVVPSEIYPPDLIALTAAVILIVISKLNAKTILEKIDIELLLFLMGISVIVGAMDELAIIDALANKMIVWSGGDLFVTIMLTLWVSAFLSAAVDDISITRFMIPLIKLTTVGFTPQATKLTYYSLNWGINLGDNLTPFGETLIAFNIAEQNNKPIRFKEYFHYGIMTAFFNLSIITIYIAFQFYVGLAIGLLCGLIGAIMLGFYPRIKKALKKRKQIILHQQANPRAFESDELSQEQFQLFEKQKEEDLLSESPKNEGESTPETPKKEK